MTINIDEYMAHYQDRLQDMMDVLWRIQGRINEGVYKTYHDIPESLARQALLAAADVTRYLENAKYLHIIGE